MGDPTSSTNLAWKDCGPTESEAYKLVVNAYAHSPDPLIAGQGSTRIKNFSYIGSSPLTTLSETVIIQKSPVAPTDPAVPGWPMPYFNNSFEVFKRHKLVPGAPGSSFGYADHHPPSELAEAMWYRAVEHYFGESGKTIGCIIV